MNESEKPEEVRRRLVSKPMRRAGFDHVPIIGRTLIKLRQPGNELLGAMIGLAAIGYGLVLLAALVPAVRGNNWLPAVGITFLSVGTSTSCALLVARQAAAEGYRRDANLRRKDEIYAPLRTQLKQLLDQLVGAARGVGPFPQWVEIPGVNHPLGVVFLPGYPVPQLDLWATYRSDHRIDAFTPAARVLLDTVLERARAYDNTLLAVRDAARELLQRQLQQAIAATREDPAYARWRQQQEHVFTARGQSFPADLGSVPPQPDPLHQRFAAIAFGLQFETPDHPLHAVWAGAWLEALPIHEPGTLGWLLASRPDEAARVVFTALAPTQRGTVAPQKWYEEQLAVVATGLKAHGTHEAWTMETQMLEGALRLALARVAEGLLYIRDRYEGGEPPV